MLSAFVVRAIPHRVACTLNKRERTGRDELLITSLQTVGTVLYCVRTEPYNFAPASPNNTLLHMLDQMRAFVSRQDGDLTRPIFKIQVIEMLAPLLHVAFFGKCSRNP